MQSLKDILARQIPSMPNWKSVQASVVIEQANSILVNMFGKSISKFAKAMHVKNNILTITCLSSVIAQELRINEKRFIQLLNTKLGGKMVDKLRYLS